MPHFFLIYDDTSCHHHNNDSVIYRFLTIYSEISIFFLNILILFTIIIIWNLLNIEDIGNYMIKISILSKINIHYEYWSSQTGFILHWILTRPIIKVGYKIWLAFFATWDLWGILKAASSFYIFIFTFFSVDSPLQF